MVKNDSVESTSISLDARIIIEKVSKKVNVDLKIYIVFFYHFEYNDCK